VVGAVPDTLRVLRGLLTQSVLGASLECLVHRNEAGPGSTYKRCLCEANHQTAKLLALYEADPTGRTPRNLEVVLSIEDATE